MNSTYFIKKLILEFDVLVYSLDFIVGGDKCNSDTMYTISDVCKCLINDECIPKSLSYHGDTGLSVISYIGIYEYSQINAFKRVRILNINNNQFTMQ